MPRKTNEQFVAEARAKFPHIEILSEYTESKGIMTFKCSKHDYIFTKRAVDFLHSACGCNLCARLKYGADRKKSPEWFSSELTRINPTLEQLSEYKSMQVRIKVRCKICNNTYESKPSDLLYGHSCKRCAMKKQAQARLKDHAWFLDRLKAFNPHYDSFDVVSEYHGTRQKVECRCKKCMYKWDTYAANLIDKRGGSGCPNCHRSKGEAITFNYLRDNNIDFEEQKEFSGLLGVYGFPLSYDFYIPSKNTLIEINGLQHFQSVDYFGGQMKFNRQQEHDRRKRQYAKENGYRLLEIPYIETHQPFYIEDFLQANL